MRARAIDDSVLAVLSAGRCAGDKYFLPDRPLDRKLYESTNKVLTALGGKWNRSAKAHVFGDSCEEVIEAAIETGEFTLPADMGWFPTPAALAAQVVEMAGVTQGARVLEPSAGKGAIAIAARDAGALVDCVEIDASRAADLRNAGLNVIHEGDFLSFAPAPVYDLVVMNPPFAKRADIHHVRHALNFLRPGGRLVSIMSGGIEFRDDNLTREFRDQCASIERLPDESFRESGTSVRTVVIVIDKAA